MCAECVWTTDASRTTYRTYSCTCQTELNAWPRSGVMEAKLLSAELLSRPMLSKTKVQKKKFAEVLLFLYCVKSFLLLVCTFSSMHFFLTSKVL